MFSSLNSKAIYLNVIRAIASIKEEMLYLGIIVRSVAVLYANGWDTLNIWVGNRRTTKRASDLLGKVVDMYLLGRAALREGRRVESRAANMPRLAGRWAAVGGRVSGNGGNERGNSGVTPTNQLALVCLFFRLSCQKISKTWYIFYSTTSQALLPNTVLTYTPVFTELLLCLYFAIYCNACEYMFPLFSMPRRCIRQLVQRTSDWISIWR